MPAQRSSASTSSTACATLLQEGVALRRTKPRLCSGKSRTLTELAPRRVDARERRRHVRLSGQARTREERAGMRHGIFLDTGFVVCRRRRSPPCPRTARRARCTPGSILPATMASISPAVSISGTGEAVEQVDRLLGRTGSIAVHLLSDAPCTHRAMISLVKPPTTAVIGCTERPPTFVQSSLPKAFKANA